METAAGNRGVAVNGWRFEPVDDWFSTQPRLLEAAINEVLKAIEGGDSCLYHRSRHAMTYVTQITDDSGIALEVYIKAYHAPRGATALKQMMRGGRAGNVVRITRALGRAGFGAPPILLSGAHAKSRRTMVVSRRADGVPLPDLLAGVHSRGDIARKRALLRALGDEVARLHRAGFIHGDLTPYNVFVAPGEPPRFTFLDHDRTRRGFFAGRRYRQLRNLVQLGRFDLPGLSNADRLRVLRAYAAGLGRTRRRAIERLAAWMLARRKRRDAN